MTELSATTNEALASDEGLQAQFDELLHGAELNSGAGKVVLTMHDLPAWPHWRSPASQSASAITQKILASLDKHDLKDVYNFTNSGTGLLPGDSSTTLPHDPSYRGLIDSWVAAGQHVANHTHSHAAVYEVGIEDLKADIRRADEELRSYITQAPSKLFCFCTDCQGDTQDIATDLAEFVSSLGYRQLSAASMVFEWRWEMAYLGALADKDEALATQIRDDFVAYSVRQTVLDCKRARLLAGEDFIPSLLLHMLNIVADTMDDWLAALKAAGCSFVPAESSLEHPFWKILEGKADPEHQARPALAKVANVQGLTWQESCDADMLLMSKINHLGELAVKNGSLTLTHHLGERDMREEGPKF
eukprot:COSAG05_NODE_2854_length_2570_cov_2.685552_2_plen_360_part_00